ncbi:hypothetical protein CC78DRAFT_430768, partial [Lojkania enalia]
LNNLSWCYRVRGFHKAAVRMGREALEIRKRVLEDEQKETLAAIYNMCRILFEQGKITDSEEVLMPAVGIYQRTLGDKHEDTLRSQGHLAA